MAFHSYLFALLLPSFGDRDSLGYLMNIYVGINEAGVGLYCYIVMMSHAEAMLFVRALWHYTLWLSYLYVINHLHNFLCHLTVLPIKLFFDPSSEYSDQASQ
jgi:hypothetical protein